MSSPLLYIFLLFALFISHCGATTKAPIKQVRDFFGRPLRSAARYYIMPVGYDYGRGLTMSKSKSKTCPKSVIIQDISIVSQGLPLKFSPYNKSRTIVPSTDLNIEFSKTSIWKVDSYDKTTKQWFISTCGVKGNPGQKTVGNWFKIESFESDYKIVFCPSVCKVCKVMCKDVGVFAQGGKNRLVLSDVPLKVTFFRDYTA